MEAQIYAALGPLVSGRAFPDVAPVGTALPYIVYQTVGGSAINYTEGSIPDRSNARIQVRTWAATRLAATGLAKQVEDAMRGAAGLQTSVMGAYRSDYDEETELRGTIQEYSIWY